MALQLLDLPSVEVPQSHDSVLSSASQQLTILAKFHLGNHTLIALKFLNLSSFNIPQPHYSVLSSTSQQLTIRAKFHLLNPTLMLPKSRLLNLVKNPL